MNWEELVEQSNIVDYVSQFADLEEKGGELWCNCPIHEEFTPSFSINEEEQTFYCFGCNHGGTILNFIMCYHKCNFPQALKILKEFYDIKNEVEYVPPPEIVKILKQYKPKVKNRKTSERRILSNDVMKKYDKRIISLWQEEGISQDIMDKYQVRYDIDKNNIVLPIWDNYGRIVNIMARNLNEFGPKYYYYNKLGTLDLLYGFWQKKETIKQKNEIILVEGCKSVFKLEGWGYDNVVAVLCGNLSDEQIPSLVNLGVNVVVAFDKDKDPRTDANVQKLKRFCKVNYIFDKDDLLGKKDSPCDAGIDIWEKLYNERKKLK